MSYKKELVYDDEYPFVELEDVQGESTLFVGLHYTQDDEKMVDLLRKFVKRVDKGHEEVNLRIKLSISDIVTGAIEGHSISAGVTEDNRPLFDALRGELEAALALLNEVKFVPNPHHSTEDQDRGVPPQFDDPDYIQAC